MAGACPRPASASPRRRRARCTSAPPWSPSPTRWPRARSAASCCCASTTPTRERTVEGAEQGILDDLAWLGLELAGRARAPERAARAAPRGRRRSCSRRRTPTAASARPRRSATTAAAARSRAPRPSGGTTPARPNVIRFRVPAAEVVVEDATRGPGALRRRARSPTSCSCARTGGPTFDLATAVDDRDLAITHIVRGEDHLANSARHLLLLRALGAVEPVFAHCPIIVGADGERLSTRRGAEPLARAARARRAARGRRRVRGAARLPGAGRRRRGRAVRGARRSASRSRASGAARRTPIPRTSPGWGASCWQRLPLGGAGAAAGAVPARGHAGSAC